MTPHPEPHDLSRNPGRLLACLLAAIVVAELAVMLGLILIGPRQPWMVALLDALCLAFVLCPVLYRLVFVPLMQEVTRTSAVASELAALQQSLEDTVNARTLELTRANEQLQREMTHGREMEEHLLRAQHFEAIGQLAAGVAHEINTPTQYVTDNVRFAREIVTNVMTTCEAVEHDASRDCAGVGALRELPDVLTDALDGLARISAIVQGVRTFTHRGTDERKPTSLCDLIDQAIKVSKNEWKHTATVERSYAPNLPLVPCRGGDIGQAMLNVLLNASQAIQERQQGDPAHAGRIEITVVQRGLHLFVTVRDNGVGIPPKLQRRIFEPFFTTKQVGRGTGYGLSQVYKAIHEHGGTIAVDSAVNEGTAMTMSFPLAAEGEVAA